MLHGVCGGGLDGHDLMCVRVVPTVYTSTRVLVMVNRYVYAYNCIIHACIRMCLFIYRLTGLDQVCLSMRLQQRDARGCARADVDDRCPHPTPHDKP